MVCYDMFGCPELGNWSSIWCVDVFDIGSNASTFRRRHLTDDPMTMTGALTGPAPAGFAALLVGGEADTSRGKVIRPRNPHLSDNLTKPGVPWAHDPGKYYNLSFAFEQTYAEYGSYSLQNSTAAQATASTANTTWCPAGMCTSQQSLDGFELPLLPNRKYIIAVVLRSSFDASSVEIDFMMRPYSPDGHGIYPYQRLGGLPHSTYPGVDGWSRWEWTYVTPQNVAGGYLSINE